MGKTALGDLELIQKLPELIMLSDKQRNFVLRYVQDWNSTAAARDVGYKNPDVTGRRLIDGKKHPKVTAAIAAIQRANAKIALLTKDDILLELSRISMRDIIDFCDEEGNFCFDDPRKLPPEIRRSIDGLVIEQVVTEDEDGNQRVRQKVKVKMSEKLKAMDMLLKAIGGYAPTEYKVGFDWDAAFSHNGESDNLNVIEGIIASAGGGS